MVGASSLETASGQIQRCDFHSGGRFGISFSKILLKDEKRYFEVEGRGFRDTCIWLDNERPEVFLSFQDVGKERYPFGLLSPITWPSFDIWDLRTTNEAILDYE